ncbi:MAG: hypothetical protein V7K50_03095 [Nostoc sp.]|uniref:hypothetical protein n=1 Tax=Nostoc sp. TaxID=1180 RepID=UPI002FF8FFD4
MDPISLILAALVAGAKTAGGAVAQDAYNGLKALIKHKFESQGKSDSATILDKYEQKPEKTKALLEDELTEAGADKDEEIIKLAQKLMKQLHPQEAAEGKFSVQISGGTVQGLTQQNTGTITQNYGKDA